jgi:hypothetical protein
MRFDRDPPQGRWNSVCPYCGRGHMRTIGATKAMVAAGRPYPLGCGHCPMPGVKRLTEPRHYKGREDQLYLPFSS